MSELNFGFGGQIVLVCILAASAIVLFVSEIWQRRGKGRRFWRPRRLHSVSSNQRRGFDANDQLSAVMAAPFEKQRIMNAAEYRAFKIVEEEIAAARRGYRVFAQTSLGEILRTPSEDAFFSINSKRIDILIVDRSGWPVLAIEYQGDGHYQGTAAARDAVKKEALRKAGVKCLELFPETGDEQIRSRLREHFGWPSPNKKEADAYTD